MLLYEFNTLVDNCRHFHAFPRLLLSQRTAHYGLIGILYRSMIHLRMALLIGQISRFDQHPPDHVYVLAGAAELGKIDIIGIGGISSFPQFKIHDKGSTVPRCKSGVIAADQHIVPGIARMQGKFARRLCQLLFDQLSRYKDFLPFHPRPILLQYFPCCFMSQFDSIFLENFQ